MMNTISNLLVYGSSRYKVPSIVITFILSLSLLMTTVSTYLQDLDVYARCPNGTHKSPSGDCEKVIESSTKLPRCPNGFHRSPSGICERVTGSTSSNSSTSSSSSSSDDISSIPNSIFKDINSNNPLNNGQQNKSEPQNNFPSSSNTVPDSTTTTTINSVNTAPPTNPPSGKCDQSLWNHVYHPERLQIIDSCKSVLGTIESKKSEPDGDFHIRLKLDPSILKSDKLCKCKWTAWRYGS